MLLCNFLNSSFHLSATNLERYKVGAQTTNDTPNVQSEVHWRNASLRDVMM